VNVYDFAAAIDAKRASLRHTHGVQLGLYTNDPGDAATSPGPAKEVEVPRMGKGTTRVNPCSASSDAS
jgi:hypothetical protein